MEKKNLVYLGFYNFIANRELKKKTFFFTPSHIHYFPQVYANSLLGM